jgi:hypothetical protein
VGVAASANATPLQISNIVGDWTNPTFPGPAAPIVNNQPGQGTDTVTWGVPVNIDQSGYDFTPTAGTITPTLGVPFVLGTFVHHNNPVMDDGSIITGIDYALSLMSNGSPLSLTDTIHFDHNETDNFGPTPCPAGVPSDDNGCDDVVTVSSLNLNSLITVGSDSYFFNLLGFSTDGGESTQSQFFSAEQNSNRVQLFAVVTPQPVGTVPEPASLVLLGTGLMAGVRHWRKSRAKN